MSANATEVVSMGVGSKGHKKKTNTIIKVSWGCKTSYSAQHKLRGCLEYSCAFVAYTCVKRFREHAYLFVLVVNSHLRCVSVGASFKSAGLHVSSKWLKNICYLCC